MCLARRLSPRRPTDRLHFHCAAGLSTQGLARMLHSLVRVSRRVGCSHSNTNNCSARCDRPPAREFIRHRTLHADSNAVPRRSGAAQGLPREGGPALPVILGRQQTSRLTAISIARIEQVPARQPSRATNNRRWPACTRVQRSRQPSGEQGLSALADRHRCSTSLLNLSRANSAAFASLLTVSRSF